jgi:hypothetical protein
MCNTTNLGQAFGSLWSVSQKVLSHNLDLSIWCCCLTLHLVISASSTLEEDLEGNMAKGLRGNLKGVMKMGVVQN